MVCPFINCDDARCAENMKLDKIDVAMTLCGDDFTTCQVFWEQMSRIRDGGRAEHTTAA